MSIYIDSPHKAPVNQKINIRNDLLIFQDMGINEQTLVKTEIRGSGYNGNNVFTSHNIKSTSVNYGENYSEQTIPSNVKS